MRFFYKQRYLKRFNRFSRQEQLLIHEADRQIRAYYVTRQAPFGLGIKLLFTKGPLKVFEARAAQAVRIVWVEESHAVYFGLVGSHEDVTHYLRSLR